MIFPPVQGDKSTLPDLENESLLAKMCGAFARIDEQKVKMGGAKRAVRLTSLTDLSGSQPLLEANFRVLKTVLRLDFSLKVG